MRLSPEVNVTEEDLFGYKVVLHQLDPAGGIENTRLVSVTVPQYTMMYNSVTRRYD